MKERKNNKMKKILYVTSADPEAFNGAAIGAKKIVNAFELLEKKRKIEWYGIVNVEKNINLIDKFEVKIRRTTKNKYISRVFGYGEQLELYSKRILKVIEEKNIEIVFLQGSRLGNLSQKIKKKFPGIKIIQNFDNFEYEFTKMYTKNMNFFIKWLEKKIVKKTEKKALMNMDYGILLTEKDKKNIEYFYEIKFQKYKILPLVYSNIFSQEKKIKKKKQVIFTGSLNMEANIDASLFLIDNYKKLLKEKNLTLVLAGKNPNRKIEERIKELKLEKDIKIISNPSKEQMEILLRESILYISPVFEGSGVKTKILEATFYGLPIIASEHSIIGYTNLNLKYIKIFKEKNIEMIEKFLEELLNYEIDVENEIRDYFFENFSEGKFIQEIENIVDSI